MTKDVSRNVRLLQVVFSVFFCLTSTGVVFGYAALKPVLLKKGLYSHLCEGKDHIKGHRCVEQDLRLNFMFTLATVCTNGGSFPIGVLLDYVGPRYTSILGAIIFALGNFFFGLELITSNFDSYYVGYLLLAIGGPLIFLSQFHLSNTFPRHSGLILSFISGAFDCSSFPYLLFRYLDSKYNLSIRTFFWAYMSIPILLLIEQIFIAPKYSYKQGDFDEVEEVVLSDDEDDIAAPVRPKHDLRALSFISSTPLSTGFSGGSFGGDMPRPVLLPDQELPEKEDTLLGAMAGRSVKDQLKSSYFILIVFFLCVYMSRINYYIQTVGQQLMYYLPDKHLAESMDTAFTILLPVGGVVGVPIIGLILDNLGSGAASVVIIVIGLAYGVLAILPYGPAQLVAIGFFVVMRPLMYTFMSDYTGRAFGFETFGTVYGLLCCIAGLCGLLLRPVDLLVNGPLHGNYDIVNTVFIVLGLISAIALTWRIYRRQTGQIVLTED